MKTFKEKKFLNWDQKWQLQWIKSTLQLLFHPLNLNWTNQIGLILSQKVNSLNFVYQVFLVIQFKVHISLSLLTLISQQLWLLLINLIFNLKDVIFKEFLMLYLQMDYSFFFKEVHQLKDNVWLTTMLLI